jgi:hypothetical protein
MERGKLSTLAPKLQFLADDHNAAFRNRKPLPIDIVINPDLKLLRDLHLLINDRLADYGPLAHIYTIQKN